MDIIKKCCEINSLIFPNINKNIKFDKLFNIFNSYYSIFLTNKFFRKYSIKYNLILRYFKNYDIVYLNYNNKNDIINIIDIINQIISIYIKFSESIKDNKEKITAEIFFELYNENNLSDINEYQKNLLTYKLINDLIFKYKIKKIKKIYFLDNNIEPLTLYKKISFSKEEIFFSFETYIIKRREYKLRTFCQIAEKLGATTIEINSIVNNKKSISVGGSISLNNIEIGGENTNTKETNNLIDLSFTYTNYKSNLVLNKYYINQLVMEESEFMITKEEFFSDIDFKFLIDSRCINLIDEYHTKLVITNLNELERKIFTKVKGYGINCNYNISSNNTDMINIKVKFIDIYDKNNLDTITGNNVYVMKEGFWHLKNIILLSLTNYNNSCIIEYNDSNILNEYKKIDKFLETQLFYIERKDCTIINIYDLQLIKIYNNISKINFNNEWIELIYNFFKDNLNYTQYNKFRDILLNTYTTDEIIFKNNDSDLIHKYYFICEQYHEALQLNKLLLKEIKNDIKKEFKIHTSNTLYKLIYNNLKNNDENLKNNDDILTDIINNPIYKISEIIKNEEDKFINIIYDSFKIYIEKYGFRYYGNKHILLNFNIIKNSKKKEIPTNIKNLINTLLFEIENILYSNFDYKFLQIIMKIKLNMIYYKKFNINNINDNFIKELLRFTLKRIILSLIQIYDFDSSELKLKQYIIEEKLVKLMIQYYKCKNYNEKVIKYLLDYKKHSDYEKEKYLSLIDNETCNTNYFNYNIYYTWDNFKYICDKYYQYKLNEITDTISYDKISIDIDDKNNVKLNDDFLNDQQIENIDEQNKNLQSISYILNIKNNDNTIIEKKNIIKKKKKLSNFEIDISNISIKSNKNNKQYVKLPPELLHQITECKKIELDFNSKKIEVSNNSDSNNSNNSDSNNSNNSDSNNSDSKSDKIEFNKSESIV
jgi:hypothetical protein